MTDEENNQDKQEEKESNGEDTQAEESGKEDKNEPEEGETENTEDKESANESDQEDSSGEDENENNADDGDDEEMGEDVEVPEKFADIIEEIEQMPVVELNELVSLLEKKWGVSAQAVAADGGGDQEEEEDKDAYDVELSDFGDDKISVIKAVKGALGLGLKEAKGMVEDAPVVLKEDMPTEEAEELKEKVEEEGGTIELK